MMLYTDRPSVVAGRMFTVTVALVGECIDGNTVYLVLCCIASLYYYRYITRMLLFLIYIIRSCLATGKAPTTAATIGLVDANNLDIEQ